MAKTLADYGILKAGSELMNAGIVPTKQSINTLGNTGFEPYTGKNTGSLATSAIAPIDSGLGTSMSTIGATGLADQSIGNIADWASGASTSQVGGLGDIGGFGGANTWGTIGNVMDVGMGLLNAYNVIQGINFKNDYMDLMKEQAERAREQWAMTKDEVSRIARVRNNLNSGYQTGNYGASPTSKTYD